MLAVLKIEDRRIAFTVVLENHFGGTDLRDYLKEKLPDAECEYVSGASSPRGSFDEYAVTIDALQEQALLIALRDFCLKNSIVHHIDIAG